MKFLVLVAVLAMSSLAFAQYECEESCCYATAGTWDDDFNMCNGHNVGYLNCINDCLEGDQMPYAESDAYSCCGPAFMLVGLVGAVFFLKN